MGDEGAEGLDVVPLVVGLGIPGAAQASQSFPRSSPLDFDVTDVGLADSVASLPNARPRKVNILLASHAHLRHAGSS